MRQGSRVIGLIGLFLLSAMVALRTSPLQAQAFYGSIVGTVTDASGAIVPSATVKVTNVGTSLTVIVQSGTNGAYSVVNLIPGTYNVDVTKASFKRFLREKAVVEVGQTTRVDAALQVGAVNETVEVTTNAPLLETDSSTLGQEVEGAEVQEMPLNGRNVMNLMALAPGVVPSGGAMGDTGLNQGTRTGGGAGWGDYQIGGAIQGESGNYIDGVANNILGGNLLALVPTQDAIQEFNVESSNPGAEFGRYSGGVVNMTTRSGTNAWHGSLWEYFRNTDFNANDFFSNQSGTARPKFNQNQYGTAASGPIKRDKAFFMFTWEGFKALTGDLTPTNVPTLAMQNGVLPNGFTDPLGACNVQPYTGQTINGMTFPSGGSYITNLYGPALPNTNGLTTCGDPTNEVIKQFYPLPNSTLPSSNWFLATPLTNHANQYNGRVDYTLSPKQRLFSRYTYWATEDTAHSEWLDQGYKNGTSGNGTTWPTNDGATSWFTHQAVVGDTYTLSPTTVLDVRLNYLRQYESNLGQAIIEGGSFSEAQFGTAYAALAPQMSAHNVPGFNASGGLHNLYNMGNYPTTSFAWNNTYAVNASLIKIVGAHSFKFGGEARLLDESALSFSASGSYTYNTSYSGDEWANFLMGYPTGASFKTSAKVGAYMYYQGYYVTDNWQAARNLTLNLGLRYELPGAIAARNNNATVLLPNAVDPYTGITGTESLVETPLYPGRTTVIPEHNLFAPSIGFAYRATTTTVVRGGYGISYLPNDLTTETPNGSYVNGATTAQNVVGSTPVELQTLLGEIVGTGLTQPFYRSKPNFMTLLGSKTTFDNQKISGTIPNQPFPYTQHWNVALSHEFKGNLMGEVSYSGLKGINLPQAGSRDLNELADNLYNSAGVVTAGNLAGQLLSTKTGFNCPNTPGFAAGAISVGQCLLPYPYYNNVSDSAGFYAIENYRAITAKAEKRMGAAGVIIANYVRAKNMANTDTQESFIENKSTVQGGNGDGTIQDYNNLAGEYSLISYDVTNRGIVSYVANLPFGKGQKFGNSYSGTLNSLVSGWALNGVTTFQSGFPIFLYTAGSSQLQSSFGAGQTRPIVAPGCNKSVSGSGLAREQAGTWFNTSCFENVTGTVSNGAITSNGTTTLAPGDAMTNPLPFTPYQFGNEPRVDPTLRQDGIKNFDVAFQKSTPVYERTNVQFRVELFNAFNRVQFSPPGEAVGGAGYGTIAYQQNKPRQIQLSLRVNY